MKLLYHSSILSLLILAACNRSSTPASTNGVSTKPAVRSGDTIRFAPDSPQLEQIRVDAAETAEVPIDEVVVPGKVEPNPSRMSRVLLPVPGRVRELLVGLGDSVQQGQSLLTLESQEVSSIQSAFRQAEANVSQAEAAMAQSEADLARARDLLANRAIAQKEVLALETGLVHARAAVEQASASREELARRTALLGLDLKSTDPLIAVRAPVAGKVAEVSVAPGEYRGDATAPVLTVADLSTIWVAADVPEHAIRLIHLNDPVEITLLAFPNQMFRGRVKRIGDVVDPQTRTIKVRAELANPRGDLRPEMFATIRQYRGTRKVPTVPKTAVLQQEGTSVVYVELAKGQFQEVPITVIWQGDDRIGISGIKPDSRVVTDGTMLLKGAAY